MSSELSLEQKAKLLNKKVSKLYNEVEEILKASEEAEKDHTRFPAFRGRYKVLDSVYNDFINSWDSLYEMYILMDKETDFPIKEKYRTIAKDYVYKCHSVYEGIMNPVPLPVQPAASDTGTTAALDISATTSARARLPKIQIPTFHGDILKWVQFKDIFVSLVHDETALTPIEKFHYLVGCLKGEPLQLISTYPLSAINYQAAWDALNTRFGNKRVLAAAYMQRIRQFKPSSRQTNTLNFLRSFLKAVDENFSTLKALKIPNEADFLKLDHALESLDSETRRLFEENQKGQEFPTYDSLIQFIQQRCQILELASPSAANRTFTSKPSDSGARNSKVLSTFNKENPEYKPFTKDSRGTYKCPKCSGNHLLFRCFTFNRLPLSAKLDFIQKGRICGNCLRPGHMNSNCGSKYLCTICKGKHHTILHQDPINSNRSVSKNGTELASQPSTSLSATKGEASGLIGESEKFKTVLLGTAIAHIRDWKGDFHPIRIVIDSGSQFSIVTTDCARRLGLTWVPAKRTILGVGCSKPPPVKGTLRCHLRPNDPAGKELHTNALVMPVITSNLPSVSLSPALIKYFDAVKLADSSFYEAGTVDFLLGSDLFLQALTPEQGLQITDTFGTLPTIFGHVVIGVTPEDNFQNLNCLTLLDNPLSDEILKDFWTIEESLPADYLHPEEILCEAHFKDNVSRLPSGRYVVGLPLRNPDLSFPGSKQLALKRFRNLERRLEKDSDLKEKYDEFMRQYIDLDHMELATEDSAYVIPHHAVLKKEIGTNQPLKLRVVYDASMTVNGTSLNENLFIGPKLQLDITSIIMNFRIHRIVFCTDIVKMFRQILIKPEDRRLQHILWRFSQEQPIQVFELKTLVYGLASSPFLALRVVRQLVEDHGSRYPAASRALQTDVYVDDVITGSDSLENALMLKDQIISLLSEGCFEVHKWASNSEEFLKTIPSATRAGVELVPKDSTTKVLGMLWDAEADCFYYQVDLKSSVITKRSILSVIARLFDPLGFLAPIIFFAKVILQQLWLLKLDWDDHPPENIIQTWNNLTEELPRVNEIKIPRWFGSTSDPPIMFIFCDASQRGYAAVAYLRVTDNFITRTFLIKAKTRLSPVKTVSVPRLELCGAHLLTKLLKSLKDFCEKYRIHEMLLFTDSTIVLSWLRISPSELKTFVANRVGYILSYTDVNQWHYVPSPENPADVASRGVLTSGLLNNDLWWKGPEWMQRNPLKLPTCPAVLSNVPERKPCSTKILTVVNNDSPSDTILANVSSHRRAIRTLAFVFRFIHNLRHNNPQSRKTGPLTVGDLEEANIFLISHTQRQYFHEDYDFNSSLCLSNRFKNLAVFTDSNGLLRVGGRLGHAQLSYDELHPVILPPKAQYTWLLIDYIHIKYFHLGVAALQSYMQRKYYIFQLRSLLRKRIWKCLRYFRSRVKPSSPFMADLLF